MQVLLVPIHIVNAEQSQQLLIDGNNRYVSGDYSKKDIGENRRNILTKGQHPFAVILTCSDSRVPPELLFDQGFGDLFVIRVAGNVLDPITLGSVEYAVEHLGSKLVVVMGHDKCGAVKATVDGGHVPPNIKAIAKKIVPALKTAKQHSHQNIYAATEDINVDNMVKIIKNDPVIKHFPDVKVVGAKYFIESGKVEYFK